MLAVVQPYDINCLFQPMTVSSVDLTPLTEDLLMNSRTDYCSDAQTISDSAFPTESGEVPLNL